MAIPYTLIQQKAPPKSGKGDTEITYARTGYNQRVGIHRMSDTISKATTVHISDIAAVLYALADEMPKELRQGNKVVLEGIGTFHITAKTGTLDNPERVRSSDFHHYAIRFEADPRLLRCLDDLSFIRKTKK